MIIKKKGEVFLIAEIDWNFLGDIQLAEKMVKSAKDSGADAVKFQVWDPQYLKSGSWDTDGRKKYEKAFLDINKLKNFAIFLIN